MRTGKVAIHLVLLAISSVAGSRAENRETVWIRLLGSDQVGGPSLAAAEAAAARVLASAGIRVRWKDSDLPARSKSATGGDEIHPAAETIDIRLVYSTPPGKKPSALAEALPFAQRGVRVTVFFDRVAALAGHDPLFTPRVLAHEIGHVLRGTDLHSETGVMKAHWDGADYCTMRAKGLKFAREDAAAMSSYLTQVQVRPARR